MTDTKLWSWPDGWGGHWQLYATQGRYAGAENVAMIELRIYEPAEKKMRLVARSPAREFSLLAEFARVVRKFRQAGEELENLRELIRDQGSEYYIEDLDVVDLEKGC